jgi:gamma-glutamyltranspeptidase / glutathione hydrolase
MIRTFCRLPGATKEIMAHRLAETGVALMSTRLAGFASLRTLARTASLAVLLSVPLAGCSYLPWSSDDKPEAPQAPPPPPFMGGVVADEPQAAEIGRRVLAAGGHAADAVAAMGYALAVTLPSRASLGASGACLAYDPSPTASGNGAPEAIVFAPTAPANPGSADRPASVPLMARGLDLLQARYGAGRLPMALVPAEELARGGAKVSHQLAADLAVVAGPLAGDPAARAIFYNGDVPLREGATMVQPQLADTLATLREQRIGSMVRGDLAHRLADDMPRAGAGLTLADIENAAPSIAPAWLLPVGSSTFVAVPPAAERGAAATAAAVTSLDDSPRDIDAAQRRALAVAAAARQGDPGNAKLLDEKAPPGTLSRLPASTTFGAIDGDGRAVMCGTSLGNLFGTGRVAERTGILLGVSSARAQPQLLSLAILFDRGNARFEGMSGGSGQEGAPLAAAFGLYSGMQGVARPQPPEPGRANVIVCPAGLPNDKPACAFSADPRGAGQAFGVN